jgi:flagellar biosynthesis/type III secretory pathway protein FliH
MSIFDVFRGGPKNQEQPQNNGGGSSHVQNNPTVPNASNSPQQNPTTDNPNPESPVANFNELWKMEPTQQNQAPNFRIDPQQLSQVTANMNFASSVSRDDLAKIANGGEEAVEAMVNMLNAVGRNVFSNAAQFSSHMAEAGYSTAKQTIDSGLPNLVKKQFAQNDLFQSNPKLREPALQPLVMAIQSQVTQKYPNATPSEVNAMVNQYMETVGQAFTKETPQTEQNAKGSANFDFSSFLA